jgi:hypothetical protein
VDIRPREVRPLAGDDEVAGQRRVGTEAEAAPLTAAITGLGMVCSSDCV